VPVSQILSPLKFDSTRSASTFIKCHQHQGDHVELAILSIGSQSPDPNFSLEFEIANEDWNESKIDNGKMGNYSNTDCLLKISKLQKLTCMCKTACNTYCTKVPRKE
jgi:hypothetical protein